MITTEKINEDTTRVPIDYIYYRHYTIIKLSLLS